MKSLAKQMLLQHGSNCAFQKTLLFQSSGSDLSRSSMVLGLSSSQESCQSFRRRLYTTFKSIILKYFYLFVLCCVLVLLQCMERCSGREQDRPLFVVPLIIIKAFLAARQHPPQPQQRSAMQRKGPLFQALHRPWHLVIYLGGQPSSLYSLMQWELSFWGCTGTVRATGRQGLGYHQLRIFFIFQIQSSM